MSARSLAVCVALGLPLWTSLAGPLSAQPGPAVIEAEQVLERLNQPLDLSEPAFANNAMSLREFIDAFSQKTKIRVLVDTAAFKVEHETEYPNGVEIYEARIDLTAQPKTLTAATVLRVVLAQVKTNNATFIVRDGLLEVTTKLQTLTPQAVERKVTARILKRPFAAVLEDLAAGNGVSIVLDDRVAEKAKTPVSATFRNDVSLDTALQMLADMVGLRTVVLESGVYVTTPENAESMRKEEKNRRVERKKQQQRPPDAGAA